MKKAIIYLLLPIFLTGLVFGQNANDTLKKYSCIKILKLCNEDIEKGNLSDALSKLKATEKCDYKNKLKKEIDTTRNLIFTEIDKKRKEAEIAQKIAQIAEIKVRKILEELFRQKAHTAIKDKYYQKAWLYNLAAINQFVGPVSLSRLLLPDLRPGEKHIEDFRDPEIAFPGFNAEAHKKKFTLSHNLLVMDFNDKNSLLAIGGTNNRIDIYNYKEDEEGSSKILETYFLTLSDSTFLPELVSEKNDNVPEHTIQCLTFHPNGHLLAFSSSAKVPFGVEKSESDPYSQQSYKDSLHKTLFIWHGKDSTFGIRKMYLGKAAAGITLMDFSGNGKWLATALEDSTVQIWQMYNMLAPVLKERLYLNKASKGRINFVEFGPGASYIAISLTREDTAGLVHNTIEFLDFEGNPIYSPIETEHQATSLKFLKRKKGAFLTVGDKSGSIFIYDLNRNQYPIFESHPGKGEITNLDYIYDRSILISGSSEAVQFWNWQDQEHPLRAEVKNADITTDDVEILELSIGDKQEKIFARASSGEIKMLELNMHLFKEDEEISLKPLFMDPNSDESRALINRLIKKSNDHLGYDLDLTELKAKSAREVQEADDDYYNGKGETIIDKPYDFIKKNLMVYRPWASKDSLYPKFNDNATIAFTQDGIKNSEIACFLKSGVKPPFDIEFEYSISKPGWKPGSELRDLPGDGISFMFLKDLSPYSEEEPNIEKPNGFISDSTGFEVLFSTLNTNKILLVNGANDTLDEVHDSVLNAPIYPHGKWRKVKVEVRNNKIVVYYNYTEMDKHDKDKTKIISKPVIIWKGPVDKSHVGLGFSASTKESDSKQQIRKVTLTPLIQRLEIEELAFGRKGLFNSKKPFADTWLARIFKKDENN